jgi:hypothetical protein
LGGILKMANDEPQLADSGDAVRRNLDAARAWLACSKMVFVVARITDTAAGQTVPPLVALNCQSATAELPFTPGGDVQLVITGVCDSRKGHHDGKTQRMYARGKSIVLPIL